MRPRTSFILTLAAALAAALPAAAQRPAAARPAESPPAGAAAPTGVEVYRREVCAYQRGGRPDPFQPLLTAADLGFRVEDLRLTGIVYSPNPSQSVAVVAEADSARRYRLKVGQRLGSMTVLRIYPQRVDVRVDEFGSSRMETIQVRRAERRTQMSADQEAAAAVPTQGQVPVVVTPFPQRQEEPRRPTPLRRGGAAPAQPATPRQQTTTRPASRPIGGTRPGGSTDPSRPRD